MPNQKKTPWYVGGLYFGCQQCGRCCSGPGEGYIWVTKQEIQIIADFLKMTSEEVRSKFLRRVGLRTTIIEQPNTRDCMFLNNQKKCTIYSVRPTQCRTWPFWPNNLTNPNAWNKAGERCPGINRGRRYSPEEIEKIKKIKNWWSDEE